ncbi:MAG TPA: hypothetical protein VG125_22080 [Pirellulales bacterium]|nr:hypothetical protein [Pirellulales bacterium]
MKISEFQEWFDHHAARFPGVSHWIAKFPDTKGANELQPTKSAILDAWCGVLRDVELLDANRATDLLASGDEEFRERGGFDNHPREVRRVARVLSGDRTRQAHARRYVDGEPAYKCLPCQDTGLRQIIHPSTLDKARKGDLKLPIEVYRASAACNCAAGNRWADSTRTLGDGDMEVDWPDHAEDLDRIYDFVGPDKF